MVDTNYQVALQKQQHNRRQNLFDWVATHLTSISKFVEQAFQRQEFVSDENFNAIELDLEEHTQQITALQNRLTAVEERLATEEEQKKVLQQELSDCKVQNELLFLVITSQHNQSSTAEQVHAVFDKFHDLILQKAHTQQMLVLQDTHAEQMTALQHAYAEHMTAIHTVRAEQMAHLEQVHSEVLELRGHQSMFTQHCAAADSRDEELYKMILQLQQIVTQLKEQPNFTTAQHFFPSNDCCPQLEKRSGKMYVSIDNHYHTKSTRTVVFKCTQPKCTTSKRQRKKKTE